MSSSVQARVVVVGNGMVGHKFVESFCQLPARENFRLLAIAEESRLAYDRVQLSSYFAGATAADLALTSREEYAAMGVDLIVGDAVVAVDRDARRLTLKSGRVEDYDYLVLATGSYPFVPPIPGNEGEHCLVYRTIDDLAMIQASAKASRVGVVVGGGLLGLEAANALRHLGLETHVVEFAPQLMAVQLDEGGGQLLRRKIEALGLQVHTGKNTQAIVPGESCRYRMNFADGTHLETDMIVFSAGIRPRDELASAMELPVGPRGGIIINTRCRTADSRIYAVGE